MDRGAWWDIVHGVTKSQTRLSAHAHTHMDTHTVCENILSQIENEYCLILSM